MKLKLAVLSLFTAAITFAQSQHTVKLTWTDSINPSGTTYTVYRATGLCSASPTFSKLTSGLTLLTYTDSAVTTGSYCYQVTAVLNGAESNPSNSSTATVPLNPPTNLQVIVQ